MSPLIESTTWLKWKIDIAHSNKSWQIPAKSLKKQSIVQELLWRNIVCIQDTYITSYSLKGNVSTTLDDKIKLLI